MSLPPIQTKVVATLGPASRGPETLPRLVAAGVDVFRLNFSHGTQDEHASAALAIRAAARHAHREVAILQDLGGPKIRLGPIPGDLVECPLGAKFRLVRARSGEDPHELTSTYPDLPDDLRPGERVLFADGTVAMTVTASAPGAVGLEVTLAGRLRSRQGINLPGTDLKVDALTPKDLLDLDWTTQHRDEIQYIALSFARSGDDVARLRRELDARGIGARIVTKIEKPQAVQDLDAIVAQSDAIMVARGDLGVEMDVAQVPAIQKRIIRLCNKAMVPVITATQMLNSMEHSSSPTRAEASDVFNAVLDGTDAVMLSGESAVGEYPIESVQMMRRICFEAESITREVPATAPIAATRVSPITEAIVEGALATARRLDAAMIVVATASGRTALTLSQRRPSAPILAFTDREQVARSLALVWGVRPTLSREARNLEAVGKAALAKAKADNLIEAGDRVVFIQGFGAEVRSHHAIVVEEVS